MEQEFIFLPRPSYSRYICYPEFMGGYANHKHHRVNRVSTTDEYDFKHTYNLHLVLDGKGVIQSEGRAYELSAGTGFLYGPGVPQIYGAVERDPWNIRWVHFNGNHMDELLDGKGVGQVWMFTLQDFPYMKRLMEEMMELGRQYKVENESKLSALLYELLVAIQQHAAPLHTQPMNIAASCKQVADYIRNHCTASLSLSELAKQSGYSMHYFSRKFHEIIGKKPIEYVMESRVLYAKRLLLSTDLSVKHIALESGFTQTSYFIRSFRRVEGMTPEQFRMQNKG